MCFFLIGSFFTYWLCSKAYLIWKISFITIFTAVMRLFTYKHYYFLFNYDSGFTANQPSGSLSQNLNLNQGHPIQLLFRRCKTQTDNFSKDIVVLKKH